MNKNFVFFAAAAFAVETFNNREWPKESHTHQEAYYPLPQLNNSIYNIQVTTSPQTSFQTPATFATGNR